MGETADVVVRALGGVAAQLNAIPVVSKRTQNRIGYFNTSLTIVTYEGIRMPCSVQLVSGHVHIRRDGHIGLIVLDHPERHNAISSEMWQGLLDAATELAGDTEIRAVLLRGEGERALLLVQISVNSTTRELTVQQIKNMTMCRIGPITPY